MSHWVTVLPENLRIEAAEGETLLSVLRTAGLILDAPCGGEGRCGKCRVFADGVEVLACRTPADRDMTVTLPEQSARHILSACISLPEAQNREGCCLAVDLGTTTVAGYLLTADKEPVCASLPNPQSAFGADVMSRIRLAVRGQQEILTNSIRCCLETLTLTLCRKAGISPGDIQRICVAGNPAMQQLLLGIPLDNLAKVPFSPVLTQVKTLPAKEILPLWENGEFLIVPDIAGFVGADTVACMLATEQDSREDIVLLVDIGTNAEMVLGNRRRRVACSAAAGPALEGALIRFGMGGQTGAIDHVWLENGELKCSVIGGVAARGICGSGLIDAVAAALEQGILNNRGKILTEDGLIHLTDRIYLTQEDIRQVQLAKGAIAAGIQLMANHIGVPLSDIQRVFLAGAFGTYMNPKSACTMGLLPKELEGKITAVGNAALSGAILLTCDARVPERAQKIVETTEILELGTMPEFPRCFAKNMRF